MDFINRLKATLTAPVSSLPLNLFRIILGIVLTLQFYTFSSTVPIFYLLKFHMTYDFFHWVRPLPPDEFKLFFTVMILLSITFTLGLFYRVCALLLFVGFSYVFLLDKTLFNNHYYLIALLTMLMVFVDGASGITIRNPKRIASIPAWQLYLIQFQVALVYFFGAISKMNSDWLVYAEPVYTWLPTMMGDGVKNWPETTRKAIAYFIAYSGLAIDLCSGLLLMVRFRFKYLLIGVLVVFHVCNSFFFNIGLFPWLSIGALILYVDTTKLQRYFTLLGNTVSSSLHPLLLPVLSIYVLFQLLFPLRHFLESGNYLWDERDILFSWSMKLRDKEPIISISLKLSGDPEIYYVNLDDFLYKRQVKHLGYRPLDVVRFAHFLEDHYKKTTGAKDVEVYAEIYTRLNHHHPYQNMIDPTMDLTKFDVDNKFYFGNYPFIVPLGKDTFPILAPKELLDQE